MWISGKRVKPERVGWRRGRRCLIRLSGSTVFVLRWSWLHRGQADIAGGMAEDPGFGEGLKDLEPELIGRVEELIDFVTQTGLSAVSRFVFKRFAWSRWLIRAIAPSIVRLAP